MPSGSSSITTQFVTFGLIDSHLEIWSALRSFSSSRSVTPTTEFIFTPCDCSRYPKPSTVMALPRIMYRQAELTTILAPVFSRISLSQPTQTFEIVAHSETEFHLCEFNTPSISKKITFNEHLCIPDNCYLLTSKVISCFPSRQFGAWCGFGVSLIPDGISTASNDCCHRRRNSLRISSTVSKPQFLKTPGDPCNSVPSRNHVLTVCVVMLHCHLRPQASKFLRPLTRESLKVFC